MSRVQSYLITVVACIMAVSCTPSVPSKYIQPDDMEDILYDVHVAQAMANEQVENRNYNQTLYFASVLEKHGVTKAEFDSSLVYYYIRADRFNDMYKNVVKRLSEDAHNLGASEGGIEGYASIKNSSDTLNVWTGRATTVLLPYPPYNRINFVQKADTSFRKGDSFLFIILNEFISQSGARNAEACITMVYDNDTVVSRHTSINSSGINQIRVPELKNHIVKEMRGYIYLSPESEETTTLKLLAIKDIQLIKFRNKATVTEEESKDSVQSERRLIKFN